MKANTKLLSISLAFYFLSLLLVSGESYLTYQYLALTCWLISLVTATLAFDISAVLKSSFRELKVILIPQTTIDVCGLIVILLALTLRLIYLESYPYHPNFDALNDTGFDAYSFIMKPGRSIFGYGSFNGYSYHTVLICCLSYLIFGPTLLSFSAVAASVSCLNMLALYVIVAKQINKSTAIFSCLVLGTMPLHLFYGRTEAIVAFTCLWTTVLIGLMAWSFNKKTFDSYALLGLFAGLSMEFYSGMRGAVFVLLFLFLAQFIFNYKDFRTQFIAILAVAFFIGLGPQLLYIKKEIFIPTYRLPFLSGLANLANNNGNFFEALSYNYWKSFAVYSYETTRAHHGYDAILSKFTGLIFLFGLVVCYLSKNTWQIMLLLAAFIIPLTHSALTDTLNMDNRLSCLFPIAAIITGCGATSFFAQLISNRLITKALLIIFLSLFVVENLYRSYDFFINERINFEAADAEKRASRVIRLAAEAKVLPELSLKQRGKACFLTSKTNYDFTTLYHIRVLSEFLFRQYFIERIANDVFSDTEIAVLESCPENVNKQALNAKVFCKEKRKFVCADNEIITVYHQ